MLAGEVHKQDMPQCCVECWDLDEAGLSVADHVLHLLGYRPGPLHRKGNRCVARMCCVSMPGTARGSFSPCMLMYRNACLLLAACMACEVPVNLFSCWAARCQ